MTEGVRASPPAPEADRPSLPEPEDFARARALGAPGAGRQRLEERSSAELERRLAELDRLTNRREPCPPSAAGIKVPITFRNDECSRRHASWYGRQRALMEEQEMIRRALMDRQPSREAPLMDPFR